MSDAETDREMLEALGLDPDKPVTLKFMADVRHDRALERHPHQPTSHLTLYGGVYARVWDFPEAGMVAPQHAHTYDHLSLVATGAVEVVADGRPLGTFVAPAFVKIAARTKHTFTTLAPSTVVCLHAVGEAENVDIHEEHHLVPED